MYALAFPGWTRVFVPAVWALDITSVRVGSLSAETFTMHVDDLVISVTDGDFEVWPHNWSVHSLIPNADGSHNIGASGDMDSFTATAFDNSTTNGFSFIDHRPLNVANTANDVIRQDLQSATTYMELLWEDLPAGLGTPIAVRAYATHVMSSATGTPTAEARLLMADDTEVLTNRSRSSVSVINGDATDDPGTTVTIRKRMCVAPSGGYTVQMIDGLKVQIGFNNIAADVNFIDLMLEVLMVPASFMPPAARSRRFQHMMVR